jgi:Spy/CpxP family protein refolding chaperone
MKKLLLLIIAAICLQGLLNAQIRRERPVKSAVDSTTTVDNKQNPGKEKNNRRQLMQDLNLSREQQKQMKEIMQGMRAKKEAIDLDTTLSKQARSQKMRALRQEQAAKILPILNDEQKEKWKVMRQEKMKKPGEPEQ